MVRTVYTMLAAAVSWYFALRYIRLPAAVQICSAGIAAAVCGAAGHLARAILPEPLPLLTELALFLITAALLKWRTGRSWGDLLIAFLLASGHFAMLFRLGAGWSEALGAPGWIVGLILALGCLGLTLLLGRWFPEINWRENFGPAMGGGERLPVRRRHAFLIPAAVFLVFSACACGTGQAGPAHMAALTALSLTAFWGLMVLLLLIHTYKRERTAALVEQQYQAEVQSFLNVIRSQRHDYNFHVQTLASLIRRGDLAQCRRYVDELEQDTREMNAVLPVRDPAISAAIHNFRLLAAREDVTLHIDIRSDLAQIATSAYETNKIIGNLLQNAIDETRRHRDKSAGILLNILKRNEFCVIRVSNALEGELPSAGEIGQFYQQGFTTKQGQEGVGLSSIRVLAGRYGGTIETQLEDGMIHFIARIPINCAKRAPDGEGEPLWN